VIVDKNNINKNKEDINNINNIKIIKIIRKNIKKIDQSQDKKMINQIIESIL
jgi:hypothetical protein